MKISELMEELGEMQGEFGDIEVFISDMTGYMFELDDVRKAYIQANFQRLCLLQMGESIDSIDICPQQLN